MCCSFCHRWTDPPSERNRVLSRQIAMPRKNGFLVGVLEGNVAYVAS